MPAFISMSKHRNCDAGIIATALNFFHGGFLLLGGFKFLVLSEHIKTLDRFQPFLLKKFGYILFKCSPNRVLFVEHHHKERTVFSCFRVLPLARDQSCGLLWCTSF